MTKPSCAHGWGGEELRRFLPVLARMGHLKVLRLHYSKVTTLPATLKEELEEHSKNKA